MSILVNFEKITHDGYQYMGKYTTYGSSWAQVEVMDSKGELLFDISARKLVNYIKILMFR